MRIDSFGIFPIEEFLLLLNLWDLCYFFIGGKSKYIPAIGRFVVSYREMQRN